MRRRKISQKTISAIFLLFLSGLYAAFPSLSSGDPDAAIVQKIYDGDTIGVRYKGGFERVRLIGIDTPESSPNKKALGDSKRTHQDLATITGMGKEAAKFLRSILHQGDAVRLEFDVERRDKYDRLLAYVYLPDRSMLNEKIIREGYATLMTYPPNVRYVNRFTAALQEARDKKRGLWR